MNTDYRIPTPTLEPVLPPPTAIKGWNIRQTDEIMKSLRDSQSPTRGNSTTLPPLKLHKPKQRRLRRTIPKVDANEATSDVVYQDPAPASTRSESKRLRTTGHRTLNLFTTGHMLVRGPRITRFDNVFWSIRQKI